ncbi:sigma-70 family RNA polymerase sigma factor [Nocardioides sp.]|jgi:RNA polymerase sigma-70 factor (ECF subfamily)|uniref:sigma-70 family RNA polymerase sigma factor n=1 Tax=Nocardioides sp. TaxID=35761 RepID=UPI002F419280
MSGSQLGRDQELSRALYEEHASALLAYVQRLVHGDRQLAEDIVQETLLRAWRHAGQVPVRARRPWLFITARHLVIDAYRARKSRPVEVSPELIDVAGEDDGLDAALDAVLLTDALRALSSEHRAVLFDSYYRGWTAAQIAAARGLPSGTVRSRIHYALRALRLALQERGVDGP